MQLGGRRSDNVIDARGRGIGLPVVGGGLGMAVLALVVYLLGGDPSAVTNTAPSARQGAAAVPGAPDPQSDFVSVVLADGRHLERGVPRARPHVRGSAA